MLVLALDTTTRTGSVAIVRDTRVLVERAGDPARTHAERLPQEILSLVGEAGVPLSAVDVFAVASGPGSFTGLRIGISTIQGLAFASGRSVVPVSALEALAEWASGDLSSGRIVGVWTDAYRREVFSALYRVGDAAQYSPARVAEIEGPTAGDPAATLARWAGQGRVPDLWVGDGAVLYAAAVGARGPVVPSPALSGAIGLMAAHPARAGAASDPSRVQPLYVRRPDAELARERRAGDDQSPRTRK
ncbi:MAG: tRNA (adenosine(37)-N6)-threonylcarbamoyltransferase complex dimerization subunit type 1 TsaB [Acidobacteria bacterium RIFCSPLOWO2_02_FULL_65_29]|nr:MAG: tRNA (adenosine(37)-N6)-threonylcarbamoyltransferase complex dimerization subunit type 1 TsaB [Acidobacteria bacterium RIFCSPLOWO2_02_FULL_65_29]